MKSRSPADADARRHKRRRRARRAALAAVVLMALVAVLTLTPLAGLWLRPLIGPRLQGVRLEGGSMRFTPAGDLIVTDATFFIEPPPGSQLRGEAARFLRVETVRIGLSLLAPLSGKDFIYEVTVSDADVLVAKPVDGYNINLLEIFDSADPGGGPLRAPGVDVQRATLTLGEYDASGAVTPLRTMRITAGVRREEFGKFSIWLREINEGPSAGVRLPARFEGAIDGASPGANRFSGTLAGIDLADWPPEAIPAQLRSDYQRFAPVGGLHKASFVYDEAAGAFRLSLDITASDAAPQGEPIADGPGAARDVSRSPVRFTMPLGSREDEDPDLIVPVEAGGRVRVIWRDGQSTWQQAGGPEAPGPGDHRWALTADLHGSVLGAPGSVDIEYWFGATGEKAYYHVEAASDAPLPLDPERWAGRVPEQILDEVRRFQLDGRGDLWVRAGRDAQTPEFVEAGLHLAETRATYRHFRYPIEDASGDIIFQGGAARIDIEGRTPSGAPVTMRGEVTIGDTITMDTTLSARGVPYDQTMTEALNNLSGRIIEMFLYEPGLDNWRQRGLLTEPFALGGEADFDLRLTLDTAQTTEVGVVMDIRTDRIGLRNRYFPLPAVGRNLHVRGVKELEHTRADGTVVPESLVIRAVTGEFTTLAGGLLDPMATVVRIPTGDPSQLEADVRIEAADVAITDLLIASIPGDDPLAGGAAESNQPDLDGRSIARRLRPEGTVDAVATIRRPPGGPTAVRIGADIDGASRPAPIAGAPPLTIDDLTGSVTVTRDEVQVDLRGRPEGTGWLAAKVSVPLDDPQRFGVQAEALAIDAAHPLENLINVFRPAEARRLAEFKAAAEPAGLLDVAMTMGVAGGETSRLADPAPLRIEITNLVEPHMTLLGGRFSARDLDGKLVLDQARPGVIVLDDIAGAFNYDGEPLGRLTISGARALETGRSAPMRVDFEDARIQSPLLAAELERVGGPIAGWQWRDAEPAGLASGWLTFDTTVTEDGPQATVSALRIVPHMLQWTRNGARARPQRLAGVITGEATGGALRGTVHDLQLATDRYSVTAAGPWSLAPGRGLGATLALRGHLDPPVTPVDTGAEPAEPELVDVLPPGVRAALPAPAIEAVEALALDTDARITLSDATWRYRGGESDDQAPAPDAAPAAAPAAAFEGRLAIDSAVGGRDRQVQVTGAEIWMTVQPGPATAPRDASADARLAAELAQLGAIPEELIAPEPLGPMEMLVQFREGVLWGLPVTGGRAVIVSDTPGVVRAPMVSADSAGGGRVAAHGEATRRGEQWTYRANLVSSALPVSSISQAVRSLISGSAPAPERIVESHGVLDLGMGIEGVVGDLDSRRGGGSLRISGGSPVNLPPPLRLLVSTANARLAVSPYDHVEASFFFEGDLIALPTISMSSRDIVILGYGFLSLVDGSVELVARSEPRGEQLGAGEIFRGMRDLLFTAYVGGTIDDPQALNLPPRDRLPAPFSQILRQMGGGLTEREWLMRQLREHAVSEPEPRHRR